MDVKQLFRNEFAQVELQQLDADVELPEFDEEGNPIPPATQLYPVCFNDFQLYIAQIDGIIQQITALDSDQIPANAAGLWEIRNIDEADQDLQALADEYTQQVNQGDWPEVRRQEVDFAELSNSHCDYLPEFSQMRDFIENRTIELEDKTDFAAWIAIQTLIPPDPCDGLVAAFASANNDLLAQITTIEQAKSDLLTMLHDEFGQEGQEFSDFELNLEEEFKAGLLEGTVFHDSPLQNDKPEAIDECRDQTDPIDYEIEANAAKLKYLSDFMQFPEEFLCGQLSSQLRTLYDNNVNTLDNANIRINGDILNLLVVLDDDNLDFVILMDQLRSEFDFLVPECEQDPGFTIPIDAVPSTCAGGPSATEFEALQTLLADTSDALCFEEYVQGVVDGACGTQHLVVIDQLQAMIASRGSEKDALISQLFVDFGTDDQELFIFGQFLEAQYDLVVQLDEYEGTNELQNDKPEVPADCEEAVSSLNDQIDELAEDLKRLMDLIDYLPTTLCDELDIQIQHVLDNNEGVVAAPAESSVQLLGDLQMILREDDESIEDFQNRMYSEYRQSGIEPLDPGFEQPLAQFPGSCPDSSLYDELQNLIDATTDALTYEQYLTDTLQAACGTASEEYTTLLNDVVNQAEQAQIAKSLLIQEFFLTFGSEGQFLEDYQSELEAFALEFGPEPAATEFEYPMVPDSCESLVEPIRQQISEKLVERDADIACTEFLAEEICTQLANEVDSTLAENENLVPDTADTIQALLGDLILIEGEPDEDAFNFEIRLQNEFSNALDVPETAGSGLSTPTETLPSTCAAFTSYEPLEQLIELADLSLAFAAYLEGRLTDACGDSAGALAQVSSDLQSQIMREEFAKHTCINDFYQLLSDGSEDLDTYMGNLESLYEQAKEEGTIPENQFSVDLPDSPDTCSDFVDSVEADIESQVAELIDLQDCQHFIIETVCTDLAEQVAEIIERNQSTLERTALRTTALLADIGRVEAQEGEDLLDLEIRLQSEFANDPDAPTILADISTPSETIPEKCEEYTSYDQLNALIDFASNQLSFEEYLKGRLSDTCAVSGAEFQAIILDLQTQIDDYSQAKENLINDFFADFGEEGQTIESYTSDLDALYQQAVDDGLVQSNFQAQIDFPETPESCSSIIDPLQLEIVRRTAELTEINDCIDFTINNVCHELHETVAMTIEDNEPQLNEKAQAVIDKLNTLYPAESQEEETREEFAIRIRSDYIEALNAGGFELVDIDFGTPTEEFPSACAGITTYDDLQELINDVTDACSFDAYVLERIDDAAEGAISAHEAEIARLEEETEAAEEDRQNLIEELYESFDIEGQTFEQFEIYLQEEFRELQEANMLPEQPIIVDVTIPPVPTGLESVVEDLREEIEQEADALGMILDFNQFAFDFVCEEAVDRIQTDINTANAAVEEAMQMLNEIISDLYIVERNEDETRLQFETRLRDEFAAQDDGGEPIDLSIADSVPENCNAGNIALEQLRQTLQDTEDVKRLTDFLQPRIDEAAVIFLTCNAQKQTLQDMIDENFSRWTDCINEKSEILTRLYADRGNGEDFIDFLNNIRAEYDALKEQELVYIINPGLNLPDVLDACPEDVHAALSVAEAFEDILEDCFSYKEWLAAQEQGFCELEQFDDLVANTQQTVTDAQEEVDAIMYNLFQIKAEDDEELADFTLRMGADYANADEDEVEPVSSGIEVPPTSLACPQEAQDAKQAADEFIAGLDAQLTYIEWLKELLRECCLDLESDYDALKMIAEPRLPHYEQQRDALLHAMWVFKGFPADEDAGTPAETLEDFVVRYRQEYDDTDPLIIPVMSLSTFIDVPDLCLPSTIEAAQELLDFVGEINDVANYVRYLNQKLAECSEATEMTLNEMIEVASARLAVEDGLKQDKVDDLYTFAALEGETLEEFGNRLQDEFDAYLASSGAELVDTGIVVPAVPELADDDTEDARDELIALRDQLAYCLTMTAWCQDQIYIPCDVLRSTLVDQLAAETPRIAESEEMQTEILKSVKKLKDPDDEYTYDEFGNNMMDLFGEVYPGAYPIITSGIDVLPVPLVCQDETHMAQQDLIDMVTELENNLTYQTWLSELNTECCQDLGFTYRD